MDRFTIAVPTAAEDTCAGFMTRWWEALSDGAVTMLVCQLKIPRVESVTRLSEMARRCGMIISTGPETLDVYPRLFVIVIMRHGTLDAAFSQLRHEELDSTEFMRVLDETAGAPTPITTVLRTRSTSLGAWVDSYAQARNVYGSRFCLVDPRTVPETIEARTKPTWDGVMLTAELHEAAIAHVSVLHDNIGEP